MSSTGKINLDQLKVEIDSKKHTDTTETEIKETEI